MQEGERSETRIETEQLTKETKKRKKKELKKLELSKGRKKQAIWFQSVFISLGGTSCSTGTSLEKEVSAS